MQEALNRADELLATMRLAASAGVNVEQLRMVLRLLLARGALSASASNGSSRTPQMLGTRAGADA